MISSKVLNLKISASFSRFCRSRLKIYTLCLRCGEVRDINPMEVRCPLGRGARSDLALPRAAVQSDLAWDVVGGKCVGSWLQSQVALTGHAF